MKYSSVSVLESQSRRVNCRRAFQLAVVLAAVVLIAPQATATSGPPGSEAPHGSTPGDTVSPEVAAAQKRVADLQTKLRSLQEQLAKLQAHEPPRADPAHASWQQQVDKAQYQVNVAKQELAAAEANLKKLKAVAAQSGH